MRKFKPAKQTKEGLTKDLAEWYLDLEGFAGERAVRPSWVGKLTKRMSGGTFLYEKASLDYAVCGWDGKERKLNGQHTCRARILVDGKLNGERPRIDIFRWDIKTKDDYRALYANLDRGAPRTRAHITSISLIGTPEFGGYPKSSLSLLTQGFGFWKYGTRARSNVEPEEVANDLRSNHADISNRVLPFITACLNNKPYRFMKRAPVIAALFETFSKKPRKSHQFWTKVQEGLNIRSTRDPAKILREWLGVTAIRADSSTTSASATSEQMYNACVSCFNAHSAGKKIGNIPRTKRGTRLKAK